MKDLIKLLKWTDPKNEKKLGRKLAPNWVFLVQTILGISWVVIGELTQSAVFLILGGALTGLAWGSFVSRSFDYYKQKMQEAVKDNDK